jgi:hypothetical protein
MRFTSPGFFLAQPPEACVASIPVKELTHILESKNSNRPSRGGRVVFERARVSSPALRPASQTPKTARPAPPIQNV